MKSRNGRIDLNAEDRLCDLHAHTFFCDGKDSPRDMIMAGISKGLKAIGLVCHTLLPGQEDWCIKNEDYDSFVNEVNRLKVEFAGRISVLCGVEYDIFSKNVPVSKFDYVIGAAHMIDAGDSLVSVDWKPEVTKGLCEKSFGGDWMALCRRYYEILSDVVSVADCDIIAHFDLVSKFNEKHSFFDEDDPQYAVAWRHCADKLLGTGRLFEINTGAMYRKCRTQRYPSAAIMRYLKENGAQFVYSSDAHETDAVGYGFSDAH